MNLSSRFNRSIVVLAGAMLFACSPEAASGEHGLGDDDAGTTSSPRGYAVVSGDYSVVSIGILRPDGTLRERELIHSGSAATGLVTALSGDVIVASNQGDPGVLTLIDRFRTDVVTRLDLSTGKVLGQVKTQAPNAESSDDAYSSNPHDYLFIDEDTAWVARYEPNPDVGARDPDRGADLLRIRPSALERTTDRIAFSDWDSEGQRTDPDTGDRQRVHIYARPSSMVRLGERLVVGLDALSIGFDAAGTGMVALIDLASHEVLQVLELDGLQSCGDVSAVPNDSARVAVGCTGFFRGAQRQGSGLVMLELDDDILSIEHVWRAKDAPDAALAIYGVCALSSTELVATAAGGVERDGDGEPLQPNDKLYVIDLETGEQTELLEAGTSYVIGGAAFDASRQLLLVPDATTDGRGRPSAGVRRYERDDDGRFHELQATRLDDILPPRQVRAFY